jgi:hypothetical protein
MACKPRYIKHTSFVQTDKRTFDTLRHLLSSSVRQFRMTSLHIIASLKAVLVDVNQMAHIPK